jgi:hypothetical protein
VRHVFTPTPVPPGLPLGPRFVLRSIGAHVTIVFAALAVSRWIEHQTGWSICKFVKTAHRCRTVQIQFGTHTITAAESLADDVR